MRIFIIRHAEPDYSVDGLTEKGKREAELLAKRLVNEKIDQIYSSPFGRARMTCEATANKRGQSFTICPWLREFNFPLIMPDGESEHLLWDRMPAFWTKYPEFFLPNEWVNVPFIKNTELPERYNDVCNGIDEILKNKGLEENRSAADQRKLNTALNMLLQAYARNKNKAATSGSKLPS